MKFVLMLEGVLLGTLCLCSSGHAFYAEFGPISVISTVGGLYPDMYKPTVVDQVVSDLVYLGLNLGRDYFGQEVDRHVFKELPLVTVPSLNNATLKITNLRVQGAEEYVFNRTDVFLYTKDFYFVVRVPKLYVAFDVQVQGAHEETTVSSGPVKFQFNDYEANGRLQLEAVPTFFRSYYQLRGMDVTTTSKKVKVNVNFTERHPTPKRNPFEKLFDEVAQGLFNAVLKSVNYELNHYLRPFPVHVFDNFLKNLKSY